MASDKMGSRGPAIIVVMLLMGIANAQVVYNQQAIVIGHLDAYTLQSCEGPYNQDTYQFSRLFANWFQSDSEFYGGGDWGDSWCYVNTEQGQFAAQNTFTCNYVGGNTAQVTGIGTPLSGYVGEYVATVLTDSETWTCGLLSVGITTYEGYFCDSWYSYTIYPEAICYKPE